VFLDPPFGTPLAEPALDAAARIVVPDGYVYLEAPQALADVLTPWLESVSALHAS